MTENSEIETLPHGGTTLYKVPGYDRYWVGEDLSVWGPGSGRSTTGGPVKRLAERTEPSGLLVVKLRRPDGYTNYYQPRHLLEAATGTQPTAPEGAVPVVGYEGLYAVTPGGEVWSCKQGSLGRWQKMSAHPTSKGYMRVALYDGGIDRLEKVATIVCTAFHGPKPTPLHEVRHLDGVNDRDVASNLAWGTHQENMKDCILHGTMPKGETHWKAKLNETQVLEIRALFASGNWSMLELAGKYAVSRMAINHICLRKTWKHI